jgi:hypothetical protein
MNNKFESSINNCPNSFETIVIPDLHGNFEAYRNILLKAWLVNEKMDRIWKNTHVIFIWDIIFDRNFDWLKIIESINKLRYQAGKKWWELEVIAWNHEKFWIERFADPESSINKLDKDNINPQMTWSIEFIDRFWKNDWCTLIEKIRKSDDWKKILTDISEFKLVDRIDSNLFVHTDMTKSMVKYILWFWIEYINSSFQSRVKNVLLEWQNISVPLDTMMNIFLNTNNRWYSRDKRFSLFWVDEWLLLKKAWINNVFYWHTSHWLQVSNIWWINAIPLDLQYWLKSWLNEWEEVFAKISKLWEIFITKKWTSEWWDKLHNFFV